MVSLINEGKIQGCISGISIDTIAYILKRNGKNKEDIENILTELLKIFDIAEIKKSIILSSIQEQFDDIEDAIQYTSAVYAGCDYIITRNVKDFVGGTGIQSISPQGFLQKYRGG